ncbi:uncharacterized protein FA14DRAFT_181477 [Meira miltonrushii]|uniref:Homeobox domain-containing protein n=1 Tax=Meira miltonrushii TaxID=1280837 RepID=A0A316V5F0_9BASI|nr:uncharacterized protein FA14DRAFT_181477 [Meira miltonrushii]PWN32799.1 hypothetical protein FA14DRAFT_181477 [Meira miltonrushii]
MQVQQRERDHNPQEVQKVAAIVGAKEEHREVDEMQGVSMDEASSPIEDRDCGSSISTASLSEPMPHTLNHSYSSSHMSQYSPTYKHLHPVNNLAYTHDEEGMQYASLEDRFPFLKDDRKRTRKLLSPEQTRILEAILERTIYPSTPLREAVARTLGIPPRKVQIWFQNKRQGRRRIPGQSEGEEETEMSRTSSGNETRMANEESEEVDDKRQITNTGNAPAPQARERCMEVQSAADDMRLARLRDEFGRQFAELKIAPAYCDGDMYPAPHLGQFERYGGAQSQSGDSYEQRHLNSALPSPASAPPHSGNYSEDDYASQRRHTIPMQHHHQHQQQAAYPHRTEAEMQHRSWQMGHGSGNWYGSHMSRSPLWDRGTDHRQNHEGFPFEMRHPSNDPRDAPVPRHEHVQMVGDRHIAQHHMHMQRTPSHGPHPGQVRIAAAAAYHHRYANSHADMMAYRSEHDMAYEARRRGLSTAPHSAPYPLLRSYSHNNPYDRSHAITASESMHRSFTSLPQGLYPPHATWNATRTNSFGSHGIRYQMPPPLSPAERPHTPGSSRSLRSFFPDNAGNHRDHPSTSPHRLQSKDRFGSGGSIHQISPTKDKRASLNEQKVEAKINEEAKEDDGRINDAYEKAKKIDSMPPAEQVRKTDVPESTCRIASLADVALRHKSRLPPLRIPSSMNNFKDSMNEKSDGSSGSKDDEKMSIAKEDRPSLRQLPRSLSSDDIRPAKMEKSSPMALDPTPSSPQSAREMRMASPSNSHSPVTPTNRQAEINPFAKSTNVLGGNDRQEVLPSITELMHS